jgi:hypothetical protein
MMRRLRRPREGFRFLYRVQGMIEFQVRRYWQDPNTIRLWDVARGAEVGRLEGHSSWVTALCVLPEGRLASASHDRCAIRLWDVAVQRRSLLDRVAFEPPRRK